MKIYKLKMDLTLVISRLREFNLGEYNDEAPTIFVEARDPDEACHLAYYKLVEILLRQNDSKKTSLLAKEMLYDITIRKITVPE